MFRQPRCFLLLSLAALTSVPAGFTSVLPDPPSREIKVLLVNGRPAEDPLNEATYFLRTALSPFDDKPPPEGPRVRPRVLSAAQFADAAQGDVTGYDCVFLCDVPRLAVGERRRLEAFVRGGGGVVFCLGPQVDADNYNTQLHRDGKLLPVRLLEKQKAKEKHSFRLAFEEAALKQPPLAVFAAKGARGSLLRPRFREFVRLSELDPKSKVRTVLSFEEVSPDREEKGTAAGIAMLEWRPFANGKENGGRVALLTTTVNAEWNNWPTSPSFVPAMHELLRFVTADRRRR